MYNHCPRINYESKNLDTFYYIIFNRAINTINMKNNKNSRYKKRPHDQRFSARKS